MPFQIKRVYDLADKADGRRILVDRLWPRGVSKERAALDEWLKDVAPSAELREWFGHVPERFSEFSKKYQAELAADPEKQAAVAHLKDLAKSGTVTLLYGAKDAEHNQAAVLAAYLQGNKTSHP